MTNNEGKEILGSIIPEGLEHVTRERELMTRYDHYFCAALTGLCANSQYVQEMAKACNGDVSKMNFAMVGASSLIAAEAIKQRNHD